METHKIKWQVSLSNGEMCYEDKDAFIEVAGELSPWQKLLHYTTVRKVTLTSLSLVVDGRTFNLPSAGRNPKFRVFDAGQNPLVYNMFRAYAREAGYGKDGLAESGSDLFTVAEAVYRDYKLQIWVDEHDPRNSWSVVLPIIKNI